MTRLFTSLSVIALLAGAPAAHGQDISSEQIDELARDLSRVEGVRAVKDLQRHYAQYAQFGLSDEMAALFSSNATLSWGDKTLTGKKKIARWLEKRVGGKRGLTSGALHSELIEDPLVNLSVDGKSAKGRWMAMTLAGDGKGKTWTDGGIYENEFVLEDGIWKISKLQFFPQYEGNYEDGWANVNGEQLPAIPFHFTIDETGVPIPDPVGIAPISGANLAGIETRIAALNAEDSVRNLQNAYGYYVDQKMWDDVVDLFAKDSVIEIAGNGTFHGAEGVRQAMEQMGEQGLQQGQFNDHPSFGTLVTVEDGNREAYTRGLSVGMIGDSNKGTAGWDFSVFRNRFVLEDGLWKIKEMRLYPLVKADYATGWGDGGTQHLEFGVVPAFTEPHPINGKEVTLAGFTMAGEEPLTGALTAGQMGSAPQDETMRLRDAERRLLRSSAYDGVVNISSAYGYYLDDFQWVALASVFAQDGNKHSPFAGFYLGQDRIKEAATTMWGEPPEMRNSIAYHWRFQPVIHVSYDGRSANLRTRLFQPRTGMPAEDGSYTAPGFYSGMYPNDQAVIEDGIWRLWSLTIDEHYMTSDSWQGGWSGVEAVPSGQAAGQSRLVDLLAPDILMTELGRRAEHFRGGTGETLQWPDILPMWFHYKNPVSGRVPDLYWPDSVPGLMLPESRLISNGFQMPPNGPEQDGMHIELTPPEAIEMDDQE